MTAPQVFREFFEPAPGVAAELRQRVDEEMAKFLKSDEYAALREQSEQRWRSAGVDPALSMAAKHRMLCKNAGLTWAEGESLMDETPADHMAILFERAAAATAPPTPTSPARLTEEVDTTRQTEVDTDFTEPIDKHIWAELLEISVKTLARRVESGQYRAHPQTKPTAKLLRLHIDCIPLRLKRKHDRTAAVEKAKGTAKGQ
jgi:hypothetical protein